LRVAHSDVNANSKPASPEVFMEPNEPRVKIEHGTEFSIATFLDENILEDAQIKKLEQALLPAVKKNEERKLILNFENVRFMSSAFLGLLVKIHKRVIEAGGHLQLYNLDPKIYKVFEITQLTKVFDIVLGEG
jgi:anti-anti-sigma factor